MTFITKTSRILFLGMLVLLAGDMRAQSKSELYLFHFNPFAQVQPQAPQHGRRVKVRFDFGLVSQYIANDPHYTTGTESDGAYTIGLKLEIPILKNADILVGGDFINENFDFLSYYFAPGYSFLYDGNMIYDHALEIDELQIPIEYKINFSQESRNIKNLYATIGWMFRYVFYNNALITNANSGGFVWEGQNDISSAFQLFTPQGSGIIEASLGYQHNYLRTGNAWFFEIEYKYGASPFIYTGNMKGSNNVQFTLNTLSFKLGMRL